MKLITINKNCLVNPRYISSVEKEINGDVCVYVAGKKYKLPDKSPKTWQKLLDDIELIPEPGAGQQYFSG